VESKEAINRENPPGRISQDWYTVLCKNLRPFLVTWRVKKGGVEKKKSKKEKGEPDGSPHIFHTTQAALVKPTISRKNSGEGGDKSRWKGGIKNPSS